MKRKKAEGKGKARATGDGGQEGAGVALDA